MKKIYFEFASSHGKMSQMIVDPHIYYVGCSTCEHYTEKMFKTQNYGYIYCENCMKKNHEDELATAESMLTDAIFKCPAKNCASKLSFSEFFDGMCCKQQQFVQYESQKDVAERFDEARKNEVNTKKEQKKAKRVFEELEKKMVEAKTDLEKKELKMREASNKRRKIQEEMRTAFLSAAHELRDPEKPEENRTECDICLEEYNNDERRESVLYCGHRSCFKCLTDLPKKLCPICRKEFTAEQIIKFF